MEVEPLPSTLVVPSDTTSSSATTAVQDEGKSVTNNDNNNQTESENSKVVLTKTNDSNTSTTTAKKTMYEVTGWFQWNGYTLKPGWRLSFSTDAEGSVTGESVNETDFKEMKTFTGTFKDSKLNVVASFPDGHQNHYVGTVDDFSGQVTGTLTVITAGPNHALGRTGTIGGTLNVNGAPLSNNSTNNKHPNTNNTTTTSTSTNANQFTNYRAAMQIKKEETAKQYQGPILAQHSSLFKTRQQLKCLTKAELIHHLQSINHLSLRLITAQESQISKQNIPYLLSLLPLPASTPQPVCIYSFSSRTSLTSTVSSDFDFVMVYPELPPPFFTMDPFYITSPPSAPFAIDATLYSISSFQNQLNTFDIRTLLCTTLPSHSKFLEKVTWKIPEVNYEKLLGSILKTAKKARGYGKILRTKEGDEKKARKNDSHAIKYVYWGTILIEKGKVEEEEWRCDSIGTWEEERDKLREAAKRRGVTNTEGEKRRKDKWKKGRKERREEDKHKKEVEDNARKTIMYYWFISQDHNTQYGGVV